MRLQWSEVCKMQIVKSSILPGASGTTEAVTCGEAQFVWMAMAVATANYHAQREVGTGQATTIFLYHHQTI